ncbi:hypothetical protein ACERJO_07110 [Halalkalibacter sp. AB-rgal2]|uniref:hypothetical protein n=1 Tax=Halalkalibacter sp. AB-rgal2 TaxID=3242695 RepID=UPI00359EF9F5
MKVTFSKPKGFGQILDHIFTITKSKFPDLFKVALILLGPLYVLQAVIQLIFGVNFFQEIGSSGSWIDRFIAGFEEDLLAPATLLDNWLTVISMASFVLLIVSQAAIMLIVNRIRLQQEYTVKEVIKQAFSKFWPALGGTLLYILILIGMTVIPIIIVAFFSGIITELIGGVGVIISAIFMIALFVTILYFTIRWSFYFGAIIIDKSKPGFRKSWGLTKKRVWALIGLYLVLFLIIGIVTGAIEVVAMLFLGNSVLYSLIINTVSLVTTLIFSVGYAVIYFDLKVRNEADDLKGLIDEYESEKPSSE